MDNPIKEIISGTINNLEGLIDTKNIVGDPITAPDGTIIIPVTNVSVGFGGGGSDLPNKNSSEKLFGGGMGGGVKLTAEAFLVINNNNVRLIPVSNSSSSPLNKFVDLIPDMLDKVNGFFKKDNERNAEN